MIRLTELSLPLDHAADELPQAIARRLGISAAEVTAVSTFYTMYKRRPVGTHHIGVCVNTMCAGPRRTG